jgi:hypothetical protein
MSTEAGRHRSCRRPDHSAASHSCHNILPILEQHRAVLQERISLTHLGAAYQLSLGSDDLTADWCSEASSSV